MIGYGTAVRKPPDGLIEYVGHVEYSGSATKAELGLHWPGDRATIHVRFGESKLREVDGCDLTVSY